MRDAGPQRERAQPEGGDHARRDPPVVTQSQESLAWPGGDAAILGLLAAWSAVSYAAVLVLRRATAEAV